MTLLAKPNQPILPWRVCVFFALLALIILWVKLSPPKETQTVAAKPAEPATLMKNGAAPLEVLSVDCEGPLNFGRCSFRVRNNLPFPVERFSARCALYSSHGTHWGWGKTLEYHASLAPHSTELIKTRNGVPVLDGTDNDGIFCQIDDWIIATP